MPNMLQAGVAWMAQKLQASAGETVTVTIGIDKITLGADGNPLIATLAQSDREEFDDNGFPERAKGLDWIFTAADLVLRGKQVRPPVGSVIESARGRYEVLPLRVASAVEDEGQSGILIRVHTKKTNE